MMFKGKDIVSIKELSKKEIDRIFEVAEEMIPIARGEKKSEILRGYVLATLFFEPSTRTRLSFETAMHRLGGGVIGFSNPKATSISKGETLADTIRIIDLYSDVIVIRHPYEGSARLAAEFAQHPVINAGDGWNEHPTQALLDVYTIWRELGKLEGLSIGVIGDLKYGRAATSFIYAISKYKPRKLFLISPPLLKKNPCAYRRRESGFREAFPSASAGRFKRRSAPAVSGGLKILGVRGARNSPPSPVPQPGPP